MQTSFANDDQPRAHPGTATVAAGIFACRRAAASSPAGSLGTFANARIIENGAGWLEADPRRQAGMPDATLATVSKCAHQPPKKENSINRTKCSKLGFVFGTALLGVLTGCVGYVDSPPHARVYAQPPPVYVESGVVVQDDYVYYPGYQVYYSSNRRQYIYREGRSWVSRPAPPRVSVDVLFASPSVRLDFHDSPAIHHAAVVRQYPKHWAPPGSSHGNKEGRDQRHDGDNKKGKKGRD